MSAPNLDLVELLQKLPLFIYAMNSTQKVQIRRGEMGCLALKADCAYSIDELNASIFPAPTKAQIQAMVHGSMWGWHTAGANPETWSVARLIDQARDQEAQDILDLTDQQVIDMVYARGEDPQQIVDKVRAMVRKHIQLEDC